MGANTNWHAMQLAGCVKAKAARKPMAADSSVKPKHMAAGSWRASLRDGGKYKRRGG